MNSLQYNPIFFGVSMEDIEKMTLCFEAEKKSYREKDTVCTYDADSRQIGLLYRGCVSLNRMQADGALDMLEYMENTGIFGAAFSFFSHDDAFLVLCEKDCEVLFIDKRHITKRCTNACIHHSIVVENLLAMMSEKVLSLSEKVDILSHRSIRGKLLSYFHMQCAKQNASTFQMPFSFLALANYLCIDRSAMMRELGKMKEEGLVDWKGKQVVLQR